MHNHPPFAITRLRPRCRPGGPVLVLAAVGGHRVRDGAGHEIDDDRSHVGEREVVEAVEGGRQELLEFALVLVRVLRVQREVAFLGEYEVGVGRAELVDGVARVCARQGRPELSLLQGHVIFDAFVDGRHFCVSGVAVSIVLFSSTPHKFVVVEPTFLYRSWRIF